MCSSDLIAPAVPPAAEVEQAWRCLIIDSPGLEQLAEIGPPWPWPELEGPRLLLPHPVQAKRSWRLPSRPQDRTLLGAQAESLVASASQLVVVGESMTLLAALRLRPKGSPLLVALPSSCDPHLRRLISTWAADDAAITLLLAAARPNAISPP